jgi:predicted ATPase
MDNSANDYVLSADQFSDGSIRFIALATLLLQPEETMPFVIIVDEPELGLHPYAIDQLNEMIKDASKHAQIIVATQSTAIIDGFSANEVTVIERDPEIQGTCARKLTEEEYHDWLEEYTLSELWNKNIIGGRPV